MNEIASKEGKTLASVKKIPKTSTVLKYKHTITTPNIGCKSTESKRLIKIEERETHLHMFQEMYQRQIAKIRQSWKDMPIKYPNLRLLSWIQMSEILTVYHLLY